MANFWIRIYHLLTYVSVINYSVPPHLELTTEPGLILNDSDVTVTCTIPRVLPQLSLGVFFMVHNKRSYPSTFSSSDDGTYRYTIQQVIQVTRSSPQNVSCLLYLPDGNILKQEQALSVTSEYSFMCAPWVFQTDMIV